MKKLLIILACLSIFGTAHANLVPNMERANGSEFGSMSFLFGSEEIDEDEAMRQICKEFRAGNVLATLMIVISYQLSEGTKVESENAKKIASLYCFLIGE